MKTRTAQVCLLLVALLLLALPVYAEDSQPPAAEKTARFNVMENSAKDDGSFSMVSADGELVIHVSSGTPVTFEDGKDAREALAEGQTLAQLMDTRQLVVTYSVSTMSLPPQTSPTKIVILYEAVMPLPQIDETAPLPLNGEVVVLGDIIAAPKPYYKDKVIMVPLRAIAEKLGFTVTWDATDSSVRLGVAYNLWLGKDEYHVGRMAPITLGTAPELCDGFTYVPMRYFKDVLPGFSIYAFEGQLVVEKAES